MRALFTNRWFLMVVGAFVFSGTLALIRTGGGWPPWPAYREALLESYRMPEVMASGTFELAGTGSSCPVVRVGEGQEIAPGDYIVYLPQGSSRNGDIYTIRDAGPTKKVQLGGPVTWAGFSISQDVVQANDGTIRPGRDCSQVNHAGFVLRGA